MNHNSDRLKTDFTSFVQPNRSFSKDLYGQVATRLAAGDIASSFGMLPNPDPVLRAMGQNIKAYRSLLADPLVMGARQRRTASVLAMERGFHPDKSKQTSKKVLEVCEAMLARLDMQGLVSDWMDGAFFGYRVSEVNWEVGPAGIMPGEVVTKPCEWFGFDSENSELRFLPRLAMPGIPVPARKFIVVGKRRNWENPYGQADLASCFWPVTFKRAGFKFWVTFTEKYGMPWAVGKLPRNATQKEHDDLADKLVAMVRDAVATVPDDSSVEFMTVKGDFHADLFERLLMYCRSEISVALLGNNQSVELESNKASAQAAQRVEKLLRDGDAQMVAYGFNQLVRMVCEVNFPGSIPPVYGFWEQEEIDEVRATRDEMLVRAGAKFSNEYWKRTYNLEDGDLTPENRVPVRGIQPR